MNTENKDLHRASAGDDGIPKKERDVGEEKMPMDTVVNLDEFTQMGDEEDHENI